MSWWLTSLHLSFWRRSSKYFALFCRRSFMRTDHPWRHLGKLLSKEQNPAGKQFVLAHLKHIRRSAFQWTIQQHIRQLDQSSLHLLRWFLPPGQQQRSSQIQRYPALLQRRSQHQVAPEISEWKVSLCQCEESCADWVFGRRNGDLYLGRLCEGDGRKINWVFFHPWFRNFPGPTKASHPKIKRWAHP